jgi:RNA polymerase sigma-70 factor (ECF subfamily)
MKSEGYIRTDGEAQIVGMGKEKTFDYFFRQYFAALCFFAQSIIHNEEEAKDIAQDCFIKLWDDKAITEKADSVKSFLYTMVRNRCIDYVRKKKVVAKAASYLQTIEEDLEYFDELAFAEMMRQVFEHIEELPANMRTILKKYYLQGKKHAAIAEELASTENAVQLQKAKAIKLLKQKLLFLFSMLPVLFYLC